MDDNTVAVMYIAFLIIGILVMGGLCFALLIYDKNQKQSKRRRRYDDYEDEDDMDDAEYQEYREYRKQKKLAEHKVDKLLSKAEETRLANKR